MLLMPSVRVLIFLLFISSIPAIAVFIWFRFARYPFSLLRFSIALLAGATSFFPALFFQSIFPAGSGIFSITNRWDIAIEIFVRIALTEEFSRLLILAILFFIINRLTSIRQSTPVWDTAISAVIIAGAMGLIAGLGFAVLESAVYGASNPGNALLRIFTAAPLHGACGFRVGSSIALLQKHPRQAFSRFLSAVIIHGIYDFMLIIPGIFPPIAAILIALFAFVSAILTIRNGMKGNAATIMPQDKIQGTAD